MLNFVALFRLQPVVALPDYMMPTNSEEPSSTDRMALDNHAIVTQTIAPGKTGQVKFQGSWWTAHCDQPITLLPGKQVYVTQLQGISLEVATEPTPIDSRSSLHFWTFPEEG